MKKHKLLALSTIFSLGIFSLQSAQAQANWGSVETAHVIGAVDWCMSNIGKDEAYQSLRDEASGVLDSFINSEDITSGEALLIQERIQEQGRAFGRELNQTECSNLKSTADDTTSPWELVTSLEGRFVIEMPGSPELDNSVDDIKGTEFDWTLYEVAVEAETNPKLEKGEYYVLGYSDLSSEYLAGNTEEVIFDNISSHIFQEMGLPELKDSEETTTTDGIPVKVFSGEGYGQSVATIMYLVEDRFYFNLIVATEEEHFNRFLRSFEVLDF